MNDHRFYAMFFIVFLVLNACLAIYGWLKMRGKIQDGKTEYFLGGKTTPISVLAFSYCSSSVSAGSFIGDPGYISTVGWPYYWFTIFTIPGLVLPGLFVIRRLRIQSARYGVLSLTDYVSHRYDSKNIKVYISILMSLFYIVMLIPQYKAAALLLQSYIDVTFFQGLVIVTFCMVFLINVGGFRSLAWSEFLQGSFMTLLAAGLVIVALHKVGGVTGLETSLHAVSPNYLRVYDTASDGNFPWYSIPCMALFAFFVMFSQPYIATKYLAIPDIKRKDIGIFLLITLIFGALFNTVVMLGLIGHVLYPDVASDYLTVTMTKKLFNPYLSGIMMMGFMSAILSSGSAILMIVGQSIGSDLYSLFRKNASSREVIIVTKISILAMAVVVAGFNVVNTPRILQVLVFLSLTGVGSMLTAPLFAGVLWRHARREGAWCAVVAGPLSYALMIYVFHVRWPIAMGLCVVAPFFLMITVSSGLNRIVGVDRDLAKRFGL
jgi:Na+/proline symporter